MTEQGMERLFEPATVPSRLPEANSPIQIEERTKVLDALRKTFRNAAIEVIHNMPDTCEEERKTFAMHVWKAYVIAAGVFGVQVLADDEILPHIPDYVLSRLFCVKAGDLFEVSDEPDPSVSDTKSVEPT